MLNNIIIIDNDSYPMGGTSQVAFSSAIELNRRGYNVYYICADETPNPELLRAGITVFALNNKGILSNNRLEAMLFGIWDYRVKKKVKSVLREMNVEDSIIHIHGYVHNFSPSVLKACSESGIKTILTVHDYFILCPTGGFYNFKENKICSLFPLSWKCIICNCDKRNYLQKIWRLIRQIGISKYARDNGNLGLIFISNLSNSVLKRYLRIEHKMYYVANPYYLGDGKQYYAETAFDYTFVGKLSKGKGVDIFCKTLSELLSQGLIRGRALVVGDGEERAELEKHYPLIQFLGWKNHEEFDEIYKRTRALVFPSRWYEGAPLTPIEFMSHGIPCIISDSNAGKDYIQDKENGLLFKSENVDSLINAIIEAENDKYWGVICNTLRNTFNSEDYSVGVHVDRLVDVYLQVTNS